MLRVLVIIVSVVIHGVVAWLLAGAWGRPAFESGSGNDRIVVDHGIALEPFTLESDAPQTLDAVDAVEAAPAQARAAVEEIRAEGAAEKAAEVEPREMADNADALPSSRGQAADAFGPERPKEPEPAPPRPKQTAAVDQPASAAAVKQTAKAPDQKGGTTTLSSIYLGKIRSRLERTKPKAVMRLAGTVVVRFTVDASGKVLAREVTSSSGSKELDDAAVAALDRASPFPPFPTGLKSEPLVLDVPFHFLAR